MDNFKYLSNNQKLNLIRCESNRIWSYLKETIDYIENKDFLDETLDENELLIYSKSCEESLEEIELLSYELENELYRLENEE